MDLENKIEAQRKRMEQIERELARVEEKMPDTAINEEADEEENEEEQGMCSVVANSLNFVEGAQIHHPLLWLFSTLPRGCVVVLNLKILGSHGKWLLLFV